METHLFYAESVIAGQAVLNTEESRHCVKVLRHKAGDEIMVTDGKGSIYLCRLSNEDPRGVVVHTVQPVDPGNNREYRLHIAIAPTKNINRFEWFLEKSTEIGIDRITPVICEHSERRAVNAERMKKIIVSAAKQSFKAVFPVFEDCLPFNKLADKALEPDKYIAYLDPSVSTPLKSKYSGGKDVLILIGPEGDFSREEINLATERGFHCVSLGPSRLRTETAGVVACHTIAMLNE